MAEKKSSAKRFSIDEILAEAHTLNGGEPPESKRQKQAEVSRPN